MRRALSTLAATAALDSARRLFTNRLAGTLETISCMSIRSMIGPESLDMYAILRDGVQVHLSPSP